MGEAVFMDMKKRVLAFAKGCSGSQRMETDFWVPNCLVVLTAV